MNAARLIPLLFLPINLLAQAHSAIEKYDTDSLERLIPDRQGTALVDVYNQLATSFSYDNPALCEQYAAKALAMATEMDYPEGMGDAERFSALMYMYTGRYPESVVHLYNALGYYERSGDDFRMAKLYYDFAKLHFYTDNFAKAEEYAYKSLECYERKKSDGTSVGSLKDIARLKSGMGLLYRTTNKPEKAKEIYRWYNSIMKEEGFEITDQLVHTQLLARCFDEIGQADSAVYYFSKTLAFPEVNHSIKALKMESRRSIGLVQYKLQKFPEAKENFETVARWMEEEGFLRTALVSNMLLGDIYIDEGKYTFARKYYNKAMSFSREMIASQSYYRHDSLRYVVFFGADLYFPWPEHFVKTTIWQLQASVVERMYMLSMETGDWKSTANYLASLSQAKDTLHKLQRNRDMMETETKYETGRKEQQIAQLAEKNRFNELKLNQTRIYMAGLGIMIILLVCIGVLLIRQNRIKMQQKTALLEQKLLRSQMNPHFIFNSMASIQDFILAQDTRSAANYLSRFARLIRNILDASLEETVPVSKEIETIGHYLQLQKARLEDKFDFIITGEEDFDPDGPRIPALLVQPFVENAIDHGIRHKTGKGRVSVDFSHHNGWLTVTVEDDGVGRSRSREFGELKKKDHASVSTDLIRERLNILNRKSRNKISLDILDLHSGSGKPSGTRVVIRVPVA